MHERRDEEQSRAGWLVSQDALHDPRGELTHRELDDDHRDREDERGQADHRPRDGGEDDDGGIRPDDRAGKRLVVKVAVERDRPEGERTPASTQSTGTNQRLDFRWMRSLESCTTQEGVPFRASRKRGERLCWSGVGDLVAASRQTAKAFFGTARRRPQS